MKISHARAVIQNTSISQKYLSLKMVRLKNSSMDGTRSTHSYNVTASVSRFVLVENHNHQFRDKNKYKGS